ERTAADVLVTANAVGKRAGKIPVTVGVCNGFVGNRMLYARARQVEALLQGGGSPIRLDTAAQNFGFAMGPCAVGDLSGLDVGYAARKESGRRSPVADAIVERGRHGQKNRAGYYLYEEGSRTPVPDPEIDELIAEVAAREGVTRRDLSDEEITERLVFPLINEGAKILAEGIATRASDIDLIYIYGYGFPVAKGGPMFYADMIGLNNIVAKLRRYAELSGDDTLQPAPLLVELAESGGTFRTWAGKG
ncbi:MAG: 3-hydroxyacyl-CoA dehydrogenase family protein, partial [Arenibacterium sp.]